MRITVLDGNIIDMICVIFFKHFDPLEKKDALAI